MPQALPKLPCAPEKGKAAGSGTWKGKTCLIISVCWLSFSVIYFNTGEKKKNHKSKTNTTTKPACHEQEPISASQSRMARRTGGSSQESLKLAFCNKPSHVTRLLLDDLKIKGSIPGGFLWHLLRDFYQALCDGLPNTPLPTLTANRNLVSLNMDFVLYCRIFGKHLETVTSQWKGDKMK